MFSQRFSPTTGKMEWVVEDEDYDMRDEIARSAYADMLHDDERNKKYYSATNDAVQKMKSLRQPVHMLDIGTGTGLLAMMAARSGVDKATACEAFPPIARAADGIVKRNGFGEKIKVVSKRSTELTVGPGCDMESRANLLVTELWDTELIGEGALPTLRDACRRLLQPGFVCVPAAGTIYTQVITCNALWNMHQLDPRLISKGSDVNLPENLMNCAGTTSAFDLHVDELRPDEIEFLTQPMPVIRFDFCENSLMSNCPNIVSLPDSKDTTEENHKVAQYHAVAMATKSGTAHGIVMWWSLDMDVEGKITLETAPKWAHPDGDTCQWRDHWMQAVYYLKRPLKIEQGKKVNIVCCHDDYSIWFDVQHSQSATSQNSVANVERPVCTCGAHVIWSRHRYCMLNDVERNTVFKTALEEFVSIGCHRGLCISDGSLLPILAASAGLKEVVSLETSLHFRNLIQKIVNYNGHDKIRILTKALEELDKDDILDGQIDVIMGEPFFSSSLFPWHNLYFWYAVTRLRQLINKDVKIMPKGGTLRGIAVQFKDLWKYHAPVSTVEGFDVSLFDQLIESSKLINEGMDSTPGTCIALEPHHVWEYPSKPLTKAFDLMEFDFTKPIPENKIKTGGEIDITGCGTCHCVVLWMDFQVTDELTLTTGLKEAPTMHAGLDWVRHTKQGVYFLRSPITVDKTSSSKLTYSVEFDPPQGDIKFNFEVR